MNKKFKFLISTLIIITLLSSTGCSRNINAKTKEIKEFKKSLYEFDENIKKVNFYYRRPSLHAKLYYTAKLDEEKLKSLKNEFKRLINIEFMHKIGDKYAKGSRPSNFTLNIYLGYDTSLSENEYDYRITSRYNKTHISDENPDNIDGYETWIIVNQDGVLLIE